MAQTATVSRDHCLSGLRGLRQLREASSAQPLPWVRSSGGCGWDHLRGFLTRVSAAWCRLSFETTPATVCWKICIRCPQVHWTFSPLTSGIKSKGGVWGERWGKAGRSGWSYSVKVLVAESCPTLRDPMDGSPPGSSVHGISQARTLEWAAIPSSRGSSQPKEWTWVSWNCRPILYHLSHQEAWMALYHLLIFKQTLSWNNFRFPEKLQTK